MAKKVVRVYFIDGSFKANSIDPTITAAELRDIVIERIGLKEEACFAIFEKRDDWERCLEPDDKPAELMAQWEKLDKKKDECQFLFKKKIFLKDDEREMEDPVAKDLIYKQALFNIISSDYLCKEEEALRLASLQFQISYGDHNAQHHVPGFLLPNLKDFVPKHLLPSKRPAEWETQILRLHEGVSGKSAEDSKTEYLEIAKKLDHYGTTFYPQCRMVGGKHSKVIIGVNHDGILLFRARTRELISQHLFTEICSWASSQGTFAFEFGNSQNEPQKYTFETKHGAIIAATIQAYIDILVQMLKNGDDDDDETVSQLD